MKISVSLAQEQHGNRLAVVSALTDFDQRRVWLKLTDSGETLYLRKGDSFQVRGMKGTVQRIGERDVELVFRGKPVRLELGDHLERDQVGEVEE